MSKLKKMPFNMKIEHYTHRITWSAEDEEHLGLCAEFSLLSLLSWLAGSPEKALSGIRQLVAVVVADMSAQNWPPKLYLSINKTTHPGTTKTKPAINHFN